METQKQSHFQEVHNLRQEVKRLRLLLLTQKSSHDTEMLKLKKEIVEPKINVRHNRTTWAKALRAICEVHNLTPDNIYSPSRKEEIALARHMFAYICKVDLKLTLKSIGEITNRDHSTVINSIKKSKNFLSYDKQFKQQYQQVCELLDSNLYEELFV